MFKQIIPAAIGLFLLGSAAGASAADQQTVALNKKGPDFRHTINMADRERLLSQKISKELLLVALGYNKEENLRAIQNDQDTFARILKGLRHGDAELALEPIVVTVLADGSLLMKGAPMPLEGLEDALTPLMNETVRVEVSVLEETDSMLLIQIMDTARRAGVGPANISVVPRAAD